MIANQKLPNRFKVRFELFRKLSWHDGEWSELVTTKVSSPATQGQAAGCAVFVKQLQDSDGMVCKDVAEFPENLRVQEWPKGF